MQSPRPKIFIGSSTEGLAVAEALQELLDPAYEVQIWSQGAFGLGQGTLESLLQRSREVDLAVLVLTGDDLLASRGETSSAPRDNVVFELGLFMGALGRERTFFVFDKTAGTRIPSDLAGITAAPYTPPSSGSLVSALGPAASKIKRAAEQIVPREAIQPMETSNGCLISVRFGRIEQAAILEEHEMVVLPANEFFDDVCAFDSRSALGAFVLKHCRSGPQAFQFKLNSLLSGRACSSVEKEVGVAASSYGTGTAVFIALSEDLPFNLAIVAVTTKRAREGIRGSAENILRALNSIAEIAADQRVSRITLPLLCAGHGGVSAVVSMQAMLVGLEDLCSRSGGRHLKQCEIVVFQSDVSTPPELPRHLVRHMMAGARAWAAGHRK